MPSRDIILIEAADEVLRPLGFERDRRNWRRYLPDMIQVVGFERDRWGESYSLVFGLNPLTLSKNLSATARKLATIGLDAIALSKARRPKLNQLLVEWLIQERINDNVMRSKCLDALDMEKDVADETRQQTIKDVLRTYVVPVLEACSTIEGLRKAIGSYRHPMHTYCRNVDPSDLCVSVKRR